LVLQLQHGAVAPELGLGFCQGQLSGCRSAGQAGRPFSGRNDALARSTRRVNQFGIGIFVEMYRRTHDRPPAFKLRSHKESVDSSNRQRSLAEHDECVRYLLIGNFARATTFVQASPEHRDSTGVQTFAGMGEIGFSR
jgi:hypothetical protein